MTADRPRTVVIGASAGAIGALSVILPALPADYPLAILTVVHVPADRNSLLAEVFAPKCRVQVKEAEDKEPIRAGTVFFAPPDYHLLVETDERLSLSSEEPVWFSRPSIDVLFESAAEAYGGCLTGVILSGANEDGAAGLRAVLDRGGRGIVQHPAEAYASMMPAAALRSCPEAMALSLEQIATSLLGMAAGPL